jgi:hypothetical protein
VGAAVACTTVAQAAVAGNAVADAAAVSWGGDCLARGAAVVDVAEGGAAVVGAAAVAVAAAAGAQVAAAVELQSPAQLSRALPLLALLWWRRS